MKVPQGSEHDLHQSLNETKLCSVSLTPHKLCAIVNTKMPFNKSGKWMLVQKAIFKKELRTSKPVKTVQLSNDLRSDQLGNDQGYDIQGYLYYINPVRFTVNSTPESRL